MKTWHAGRADKKKRKKGREESANVTRPAKKNEEDEVDEEGDVIETGIGEGQAKFKTRKEYVQSYMEAERRRRYLIIEMLHAPLP